MQNEENSTSSESLENIEYDTQAAGNGVIAQADLEDEENSYVETTMETDGHRGIKRTAEVENSLTADHENPPKPLKKTKGRVKIKMEFIENKLRRYTTFSKRKTGIMKKAYELSTLTGTQVMLLVASETGHVYTFATRKLQPMITSESGKALIQTCLNSPDPPLNNGTNPDQRMSATGYEETDLTYSVNENEEKDQKGGIFSQTIDVGQVVNSTNTGLTGITLPSGGQYSFPMTTYLPSQGNKSGPASYSVQAVPGGAFTTIFTPGTTFSPGSAVQIQQAAQGQSQQQLLGQQIQLQRIQNVTSNNSQPNNIMSVSQPNSNTGLSMVTVAEGHVNQDQSDSASGPTSNHNQYINVVPIAPNNHHDAVTLASVGSGVVLSTSTAGQLPVLYSVYTQPQLGEGGGEHTVTHLTQEAMTQQGCIPVSLQTSLSNVASALSVQQDLPPQTVTIHHGQDNNTTEVSIVDASSIGVVTENDIDKGGMGSADQNEV